jgi:hypothetical protein
VCADRMSWLAPARIIARQARIAGT